MTGSGGLGIGEGECRPAGSRPRRRVSSSTSVVGSVQRPTRLARPAARTPSAGALTRVRSSSSARPGRGALGLADEGRVPLLVEHDDRGAREALVLLDRLQRTRELEGGRGPARGVLGHRLGEQALEPRWHVGPTGGWRGGAADARHERIGRVVAARDLEGRAPDEQLPQGRREGVDVGPLVTVALAVEHLGRRPRHGHPDVVGGLGRRLAVACTATGDAEVGEPGSAVGADEHVGRLDVAVGDVRPVGGLDGARELDAGAQHLLDGEALGARPHREVGRRVVLHDEVGPAVVGRAGAEDLARCRGGRRARPSCRPPRRTAGAACR